MRLDTPKLGLVKYTGENGTDNDKKFADKHLRKGGIYNVRDMYVGRWNSLVYLEGQSTRGFNTVMFENVEDNGESYNWFDKSQRRLA